MKLSVGILAGNSAFGINDAGVRAGNRIIIKKLKDELELLGDVLISAAVKGDYEDICPCVFEDESMLEGIYNLIKFAEEPYVFVCGADMPDISKDLAEYMSGFICSDYDCYCIESDDFIQPLCAIYSKEMLPLIEEALRRGDYKLMNLIRKSRVKYISLKYTTFDKAVLRNNIISRREDPSFPQMVFCVSGLKNSGKTGLIIKLINEFIKHGFTVGAIKHDGHCYNMDSEGTDTYRFLKAGALGTAIFAKGQLSLDFKRDVGAEDAVEFLSSYDVVIIEGLKGSSYPKIEMISNEQKSICRTDTIICRATDRQFPCDDDVPVFHRDDIEGIFLCIIEFFEHRGLIGKDK